MVVVVVVVVVVFVVVVVVVVEGEEGEEGVGFVVPFVLNSVRQRFKMYSMSINTSGSAPVNQREKIIFNQS